VPATRHRGTRPSQALRAYWAIPARRYRTVDLDRFDDLTAHATRAHALGADRRVIQT
jgi:hypothetical protein